RLEVDVAQVLSGGREGLQVDRVVPGRRDVRRHAGAVRDSEVIRPIRADRGFEARELGDADRRSAEQHVGVVELVGGAAEVHMRARGGARWDGKGEEGGARGRANRGGHGHQDDNLYLRSMASPGDLDTSFDGNGKKVINFGGTDAARAVLVQGNGRI